MKQSFPYTILLTGWILVLVPVCSLWGQSPVPGDSLGQKEGSGQASAISVGYKGQLIGWAALNPRTPLQAQPGLRYIPEVSFSWPRDRLRIEGEFSANLWASSWIYPGDSMSFDYRLSPYRMWLRLSWDQAEIRVGLQKINFGSASMFRPLMWFDRIDPRDPLQLTDGVYGVLGRYYFLNNANIWLWGLYGEEKTKGWEVLPTRKNSIEYGGRVQLPVPRGEAGLSYHHRVADPKGVIPDSVSLGATYPENRMALDAKVDLGVGLWVEAALIHQDLNFSELKYRSLLNTGADYTFDMGNGIHVMGELFGILQGDRPLAGNERTAFGLLSASYPLNIIHNLSAMLFYDFSNRNLYRFVNWQMAFDRWSFYVISFWNPDTYALYNLDSRATLYSGLGFQLMAVFNH